MCSGRVDPEFVFRALSSGIDGVFIGGCLLGECNYTTHGNYQTLNATLLNKKILEHIGLNPDRLRIEFMSSGEGMAFVKAVNDFVGEIKELGPIGRAEGLTEEELQTRIAEVRKLIPYIKITKRDKLEARLEKEQDLAEFYTTNEVEELFGNIVSYYIDPEKCKGCTLCAKSCPVDAIESAKKQVHVIDQDKCIKCETCYKVCPDKFSAVTRIVSDPVPEPIPVEARAISQR